MKKIVGLFITLLVSIVLPKETLAQATRTWVSGVGDDVNPCSRTAPCKTFAGAISKTAAGGEINIIDAGAYGAVTITKSITIDGLGFKAGVLASATNGITINAAATDVVVLRNLDINGAPPTAIGLNGIRYLAAKRVIIENCDIHNFGTNLISVDLSAKGSLILRNSTLTSYDIDAVGVNANTTTDTASIVLDNVKILGLGTGVYARNNANVKVFNTTISNNARGVFNEFNTSAVYLSNTAILNNAVSIQLGIEAIKPKVFSYGNNQILPKPLSGILSIISNE